MNHTLGKGLNSCVIKKVIKSIEFLFFMCYNREAVQRKQIDKFNFCNMSIL